MLGYTMVETDDPAILADEILRAEERLRTWTKFTVQGNALFHAANDALAQRIDPSGEFSGALSWYLQDHALMTVVRVYSLFDRGASVSLQKVNQHLKKPGVKEHLASLYGKRDYGIWTGDENDCARAIARFQKRYAEGFNIELHGRLHHFRNVGVAHVCLEDITKRITYDELDHLVMLAADLSAEVSMMCQGRNVHHHDFHDDLRTRIRDEWTLTTRLRAAHDEAEEAMP